MPNPVSTGGERAQRGVEGEKKRAQRGVEGE